MNTKPKTRTRRKPSKVPARPVPTKELIAAMRSEGKTTREIFTYFGISKQRVYQIEAYEKRGPLGRPRIDETGNAYGALVVTGRLDVKGRSVWYCSCKCGRKMIPVDREALRDNPRIDCGCGIGKTPGASNA
jgi:hypothetical protein